MLSMETVEREDGQRIHQWVYQVLRANIIRLRLPPGQEISENEVSDRLGVSRTPVREAFIRLAEDGLLQVTPQKHTTVSRIDLEQAEQARFIRRAVEKAVAREACRRIAPDDARALAADIKAQRACARAGEGERLLERDAEFHRSLYRLIGRESSWRALKKLDYNYDRLRTMVIPHVLDRVVTEHARLLETIAGGDVRRVDELVEIHLTWSAIDTVAREYPPEYFIQDLRDGEWARMMMGRQTG
jgi:GntR family transcriptional regulator, rspAB operon transcriptional repressor